MAEQGVLVDHPSRNMPMCHDGRGDYNWRLGRQSRQEAPSQETAEEVLMPAVPRPSKAGLPRNAAMEMKRLSGGNLRAAGYDDRNRRLVVELTAGTFEYSGVTPE